MAGTPRLDTAPRTTEAQPTRVDLECWWLAGHALSRNGGPACAHSSSLSMERSSSCLWPMQA